MDNTKLDTKIDYQEMELQRTEALKERLRLQLKAMEVGRSDSLRRFVLRHVVDAKYKDAAMVVDEYIQMKSKYPALKERALVHANHAKELINAIRAKRNFPNLSQLALSKQQEILDHALGHFDELRATLKTIEHTVRDEALKDLRSTVWTLRTLVYVVVAVTVVAFIVDFSGALGRPLWITFNNLVDSAYGFLARHISFL